MTRTEFFAESHCPRCGAETYKALYPKTGIKAHLNREPDQQRGNIVLDKVTFRYSILQLPERQTAIEDGTPLYLNHWATCTAAQAPVKPREVVYSNNVVPFRIRKRA